MVNIFGVYMYISKLFQDLVVVCSAGMEVQSSALLLAAVSPWVSINPSNQLSVVLHSMFYLRI